MTLQEKHQDQINRYGCLGANVIAIVLLFIAGITLLQGVTVALVIRCLCSIIVIVVNTAARKALKYDDKFKHFCCCSIMALYIVTLISAQVPNMYAIMFPIAILVMIFRDSKLLTIGCSVAGVGTFVFLLSLVIRQRGTSSDLIIGFAFTVVVCVLAVLVTRVQIRQNAETMDEVNAANEASLATSNEIVRLANDLNQKFVSAKEVADMLNDSMQTSHNSVYEIAESTRTNAEAIENQTNQTADIQTSIQGVGEEARNMGAISENTSATVEEGVKLIERLKAQAFEVAKINNETKTTTQQLNESILDVQAITDTILGISSQTNLLALNASIEAARAGEAGKGFAVVADEIRNLADETRQATEKISQIIERLTKDAESAASSMTMSAEYAEKQNELIEETGEKLMDIKKDTDTLYAGVVQVNESVENIIQANVIIMDSITNLSATGQEVAASSETAIQISDSTMEALGNMNSLLQSINEISDNMEAVAKQ